MMRRLPGSGRGILLLALVALLLPGVARAGAVTLRGSFSYEDRIWDHLGYTGSVQSLPIRHADVEIVATSDGAVLGSGSTGEDGTFAVTVDMTSAGSVYARCLSATELHPDYHIEVVDGFVRLGGTVDRRGSTVHAIVSSSITVQPTDGERNLGDYLIRDTTGSGVAQAFNILDNAVDAFAYLATAEALGAPPAPEQFVVLGWNGTSGSGGSNYYWQGIYIASNSGDTDGWSDTVILHELGHWVTDMFGADDNVGGVHYIGDNRQDPRLSYGEGYPTFFCGAVRAWRASRLNRLGEPIDAEVSVYADLGIPPAGSTAGGLEFAYDFETGLFHNGSPIGQTGSANETNVTSALWDLIDGPDTPDLSPGTDDDSARTPDRDLWEVTSGYMVDRAAADWLTVEDLHQGWFATHGEGYAASEIEAAFVDLAGMPFARDLFEPDDTPEDAVSVIPLTYSVSEGGGVVINECDPGPVDRVELTNSGLVAVNLAGWTLTATRNGFNPATYTFPDFLLRPGSFVTVHEGGSSADNTATDLFGGSFLSIVWFNGDDGACALLDADGQAVDFLRWDNVSGADPSQTPVPAGTSWSGSLPSASAGFTLARGLDAADRDLAADFAGRRPTPGSPNFEGMPQRTLYPAGDRDLLRLDLHSGELLVVRAESPHSAGRPRLEILDADGNPGGMVGDTGASPDRVELQFLVPADTTLYLRVSNHAPYTEFAPLDLLVYTRPSAQALNPPVGLSATAAQEANGADPVLLRWLNGADYDEVVVFRDGSQVARLPGSTHEFADTAPRGLHDYAVRGILAGAATALAGARVFSGIMNCALAEGLEGSAARLELEGTWSVTGGLYSEGSFGLTDSPGVDYGNNLDIACTITEPVELLASPTLEFDHICITEAGYDFGIVELTDDYGGSWTELARYDMDHAPGWMDGSPESGDWVSESLDLSAWLGRKVMVRFRLVTDGQVTRAGWSIDNIRLSDPICVSSTTVPGDQRPLPGASLAAFPNPFQDEITLALERTDASVAEVRIFDPRGRLVRTLHRGEIEPGLRLTWDGREDSGRPAASGIYLVRVRTGDRQLVRRVVKLP